MTHAVYKSELPQCNDKEFLTDAGLETVLLFHDGLDLPFFAAFTAMDNDAGCAAIDGYMRKFCALAVRDNKGFVLDTPTWRASKRWA